MPKESQEKYKIKENGTLLLNKLQSHFSASGSQDKRQQMNNSGSRSGDSDRGSLGNTARGKEKKENQKARTAQTFSFSSLLLLTTTGKSGGVTINKQDL